MNSQRSLVLLLATLRAGLCGQSSSKSATVNEEVVVPLRKRTFNDLLKSQAFCSIIFLNSSNSLVHDALTEYKEIATELGTTKLRYGSVDCSKEKKLCIDESDGKDMLKPWCPCFIKIYSPFTGAAIAYTGCSLKYEFKVLAQTLVDAVLMIERMSDSSSSAATAGDDSPLIGRIEKFSGMSSTQILRSVTRGNGSLLILYKTPTEYELHSDELKKVAYWLDGMVEVGAVDIGMKRDFPAMDAPIVYIGRQDDSVIPRYTTPWLEMGKLVRWALNCKYQQQFF